MESLRKCYICERWVVPGRVEEIRLEKSTFGYIGTNWVCLDCFKKSSEPHPDKDKCIADLIDIATARLNASANNEIEVRDEELKISVRVTKWAPLINSMYPGVTSYQFSVPPTR